MRDGWKKVTIGEIGHVLRGASPRPKGDPRYYGGSVPRLMVADVTRDGRYVTPRIDFLTEEGATLSRPMPKGTLTIVCSGDVGTPSFLAIDACIHDGFLAVTNLSQRCKPEYLYEAFLSLKSQLERSATHGGGFH
jgi:type I restriction enzyme S subunit